MGVVIGAGSGMRVFAYTAPCDMRKQMNGLSTVVREQLGRDPQGGDLYLFRNRRRDMIKILFFDRGGYCLLVKRLERGTFRMTLAAEGAAIEITEHELAGLLSTAELEQKVFGST
jgi:transposase